MRRYFGFRIAGALCAMVLAVCGVGQPAQAKWREASSEHFVIYANESEGNLRRFAESLEHFHAALKFLLSTEPDTPSPSNRLTIYQVDNRRKVRKLYGGDNRYVSGFYLPRAEGSLAIVPHGIVSGRKISQSMAVLLHEYTHHFLTAASTAPPVEWLSEGAAEFWAAASFEPDGTINVGRAPMHRAYELLSLPKVPIEELLDSSLYEANRGRNYDSFYGRSWLLYHYLTFSKERSGQLREYMLRVAQGTASLEAGQEVFGDLEQLEDELSDYLMRRRILSFQLKPGTLKIGEITIRELREGEAAIMPTRIVSKRGVNEEIAQEAVADAREVAAEYPDDSAVLAELSEAELDSGHIDKALAAANKAIEQDGTNPEGYARKIYALFAKADEETDAAATYTEARKTIVALNRLENDHPVPLIYYYRLYVEQGEAPSEVAVQGIRRAVSLAPFDLGLRMTVGQLMLEKGLKDEARGYLAPVAYNPHGGEMAAAARQLIEYERYVPSAPVIEYTPPEGDDS
ncbi:tetratricopeptide repeat protein [Altericroceibacterium endophyticum]|uniref:DUF1570 domain-containing protein n=1 Tax=Altericroceibacterium endophyticum TaxID=1808508 RepID=A0A6I4T4U7_9SPHN|nr:hypothetical protein [Altericroceibacterium endophyticum]MXO65916.1 hypothetical protein [Altericroceibacterium endophyticum]